MNLSVASSVFVNYSIEETISLVAQAGYEGIDFWGGRPHIYRQDHPQPELERLRKFLKTYNLTAVSLMPAFYRYPHSLSLPNEVVRQDSLDYMRQCADNAAILGAKILLIVPGHTLYGQPVEDARLRLLDSIDWICRYASQYDLSLGIEPANKIISDLVNTSSDALKIITELKHDNLGVVLDTGHLNLTKESTETALRNLGGLLLQIHVNDNDGLHQQNLIPGDGTFDNGELIELLRATDYSGFLSAELAWDYSLDPVPAIRKAAERLRDLLQ